MPDWLSPAPRGGCNSVGGKGTATHPHKLKVWLGGGGTPSCPFSIYLIIGAEVKGSNVLLVLLGSKSGHTVPENRLLFHTSPSPWLSFSSPAPGYVVWPPRPHPRCLFWYHRRRRGAAQSGPAGEREASAKGNTLQPLPAPPLCPSLGWYLHLPALVERLDLALNSITGGRTKGESESSIPWSPVPSAGFSPRG